ncbi:hypothetical protein LCGC14_1535890 [marine sediment metagenome]|uniref:Uncharacterized protein n=1 Tax=marine sediment metagenome TaxID=412755 RepID=A0A0F9IUL8_9ZZZZ
MLEKETVVKVQRFLKEANDVDVTANEIEVGLSRKERRQMGLTMFGIYRAVRQLQCELPWDKDAPLKLIAMDVAMVLADHPDYVGAWDEKLPELDWEAVLDFIIKMLPIILKLIAIFMVFI